MATKRKQETLGAFFAQKSASLKTTAGATPGRASEPVAKSAGPKIKWTVEGEGKGSLLVRKDSASTGSIKVAAFDLDGTLVDTKSNTPFATSGSDWKLFNEFVKPKLKELHEQGYKLVIFSNQNGIKTAVQGKRATITRERIDNFIAEVGVPMDAYCAAQKDRYRKPNLGMWEHMLTTGNNLTTPDLEQSFFVGDAAGRAKDHSDADIAFAKSVGVKFHLPEDFFQSVTSDDNADNES